ncbi:ankyrin repeat and KH domain-containing protein 1 [Biomphalaria pfeifferi]|uniref:Ankyrin repeat and KH domain-containing protein 1 n=1 Tax=Biomphalaria pfeifferi TaxID=112525 RepID=A0AAD8FHQ3_BIOPF|nr:ankyrin repeat and KH domain-containing protein 1 [Biomphalaria pfeifferi]
MARLLFDAIKSGDITLAKCLLQQGVYGCIDYQTWSRDGTALFFCCSRGYFELARLLIDHGASLSVTDKSQATPLHGAADNGHLEIVRLLLLRGANVNAQTIRGDTPLHLSAYRGYREICFCLVEAGADPRMVNVNDLTPQREAFCQGHAEISNYLMKVQEIISPEKNRFRSSMIILDPPSDLDIVLKPTDNQTAPIPAYANSPSPQASRTGLVDLTDNAHQGLHVNQNIASYLSLDPPVDVVFFKNTKRSPEVKPLNLTPELLLTSVSVQPDMKTPDVSLGQGFQFRLHSYAEHRSRKLPSSDLSDFSSDSYSMMSSTASDASDGIDEIRRPESEVAERQLTSTCGCSDSFLDKSNDGHFCLKEQLSSVREAPASFVAHAFSEFPDDAFDSTIFSIRSLNNPNTFLRVSYPPPPIQSYDNSKLALCNKKQRAASVSNYFEDCSKNDRPAYNKSFSVDCRPRHNDALAQEGLRPKPSHHLSNSSFNDLSSNYLSSASLTSPATSMTCINIPLG